MYGLYVVVGFAGCVAVVVGYLWLNDARRRRRLLLGQVRMRAGQYAREASRHEVPTENSYDASNAYLMLLHEADYAARGCIELAHADLKFLSRSLIRKAVGRGAVAHLQPEGTNGFYVVVDTGNVQYRHLFFADRLPMAIQGALVHYALVEIDSLEVALQRNKDSARRVELEKTKVVWLKFREELAKRIGIKL